MFVDRSGCFGGAQAEWVSTLAVSVYHNRIWFLSYGLNVAMLYLLLHSITLADGWNEYQHWYRWLHSRYCPGVGWLAFGWLAFGWFAFRWLVMNPLDYMNPVDYESCGLWILLFVNPLSYESSAFMWILWVINPVSNESSGWWILCVMNLLGYESCWIRIFWIFCLFVLYLACSLPGCSPENRMRWVVFYSSLLYIRPSVRHIRLHPMQTLSQSLLSWTTNALKIPSNSSTMQIKAKTVVVNGKCGTELTIPEDVSPTQFQSIKAPSPRGMYCKDPVCLSTAGDIYTITRRGCVNTSTGSLASSYSNEKQTIVDWRLWNVQSRLTTV